MIIDMERKRSRFYWRRSRLVPSLEERPNKTHDFSRTIWEFIFYGPDFSSENSGNKTSNGATGENMATLLNMMKELQRQNAVLQNKVMEIQNEFTLERNRRSREVIRSSQDKQHASTQFRGYSESIEGSIPEEPNAEWKRKVWGGGHRDKLSTGIQTSGVVDLSDIILSAEKDVFDDTEREKRENDPELKELKELYNTEEDYDNFDGNLECCEDVLEKTDVGTGVEGDVLNHDETSSTPVHDENETAIIV